MLSKYIMKKINTQEEEGVTQVQNEIDKMLKHIKIEFTTIVFLNLSLIVLASLLFNPFIAKIIISISIWCTLLYTLVTLPYKDILTFIIKYKMNFYHFLYAKVKQEVFYEYETLKFYEKLLNNKFGKDQHHIVHSITTKAYYKVKKTLIYAIIILSIAYIIFLYFRNNMIDSNLHINFFDLLIFNFKQ
jgi:hypothetical protein